MTHVEIVLNKAKISFLWKNAVQKVCSWQLWYLYLAFFKIQTNKGEIHIIKNKGNQKECVCLLGYKHTFLFNPLRDKTLLLLKGMNDTGINVHISLQIWKSYFSHT